MIEALGALFVVAAFAGAAYFFVVRKSDDRPDAPRNTGTNTEADKK